MDSDYLDHPPSYVGSSSSRLTPSPVYSPTPGQSEVLLRSSLDSSRTSPQEYVYRTKNVELNLGPNVWGTSNPVFGSGTIVEGRAVLSGELKNISRIIISLEGRIVNTYTERGMVSGVSTTEVLSASTTLKPSNSGNWTQEHCLLATVHNTCLPPSAVIYQPGVTCEVSYRVKLSVVRRGLRRNDSLRIPVLYLPRTFSKRPLLQSIPDIIVDPAGPTLATDLKEVKIVQLGASCDNGLPAITPAIFLALPSSLSFASYDTIPLTLSIVSHNDPVTAKLLFSAVKIQLIKRTRTWKNKGCTDTKFETVFGVADITRTDESRMGVSVMSCELRAVRSAQQQTWTVEAVAEQEYLIRVVVHPPQSMAKHIPHFECEQHIELTTDDYDSLEHESLASGGIPSPAIGNIPLRPSVTHVY
ncbi:hypothetical protein DFH11DRAFT_1573802 [Phellopilus nigrolimitatus]|nr:hypothetical protein DFH11DRAFT_1573802 [Phellopilus nigrolimitatus]